MTGGISCAVFLLGIGAVTVVGVTVVILWMTISSAAQTREEVFQAMALRLEGRFVTGGFLTPDSIVFPLGSTEATAEFVPVSEENTGRTTLQVLVQDPSPGTLHILPEGFVQSFLKMFGAQDLSVGDPGFDADYVVKATPESLAARVFSPDRRTRVIAAVRRLSPFRHPTIELTRFQLRIQVREELKSQASVLALVKTATEFLEFLQMAAPTPGIQMEELRSSRDSACPVCGTALADLVVRCEACKTPHHSECWDYMGRCSTYACKGTRGIA
jgi:hypothetical protein